MYGITPEDFETISPVRSNPKYEKQFSTEIDSSAADSIARDRGKRRSEDI
jgi:hypothetical protein